MPRTLTIVLLFVVCALAAAAGGFVALRQSSTVAVSSAPPATQSAVGMAQTQSAESRPAAETAAAVVPEPPITPANLNVAPVQTPTLPETSVASGARTRPAPTRAVPTASASSRQAASFSDMSVTGRPGAAGTPASVEPPALSPPATQLSAPQEPPPPLPTFEEVVVQAESVLGLQVMTTTSTEEARVEDPVEAQVTRDVRIGGTVAIPAGARVLGVVTVVERGGKVKGKARLGVRFHTLVLADAAATRVPIRTDTIFRESESQGPQSATKIGAAAAGGAILGAIIGGGKGAILGGALGAGGGTANVMRGDRSVATLQAGTAITVRLQDAVTVTVER